MTPVLRSLHWLSVNFRIDFEILLLVFKALRGLAPQYLSDLLVSYEPMWYRPSPQKWVNLPSAFMLLVIGTFYFIMSGVPQHYHLLKPN